MSDQYNVSLGVCNVKIRKFLMGVKMGLIFEMLRVMSSSIEGFEFFYGIDTDLKSSCCEHILANT